MFVHVFSSFHTSRPWRPLVTAHNVPEYEGDIVSASQVQFTTGTFQRREQLSASLVQLTWGSEEVGTAKGPQTFLDLDCPNGDHCWGEVRVKMTINSTWEYDNKSRREHFISSHYSLFHGINMTSTNILLFTQ